MGNLNDIEISDNKFLAWTTINENEVPIDIDPYLTGTKELWIALETRCMASCCGFQAFDFTALHLGFLLENKPECFSAQKLLELKQSLISSPAIAFHSNIFNAIFYKELILQIIDHVLSFVNNKEMIKQ